MSDGAVVLATEGYPASPRSGDVINGLDDAADVDWFSLRHPPPLAFDHHQILAWVRRHLQATS